MSANASQIDQSPLNQKAQARIRRLLEQHRDSIAQAWRSAISPHGFTTYSADELRERLSRLTHEAIAVLVADSFDEAAAQRIGAALVALHYIKPAALGATQEVLGRSLASLLPAAHAHRLHPRMAELMGAIATGFGSEATGRMLYQQESMRDAVGSEHDGIVAAAKQGAELFRSMFEYSATGMLFIGLDGHIVHANRALGDMLGYGIDELRGGSFAALSEPDEAGIDVDSLAAMLHGQQQIYQAEKRYRRKDGQTLWGSLNLSLVRGDHGQPLHFVAQIQDITQRKREERRVAIFTRLGHDLSIATSALAAADSIAIAADELCGWDAYSLSLFDAKGESAHVVLNYDLVDGVRTRVPRVETAYTASPLAQRVIAEGPLLLLREQPNEPLIGTIAFGDLGRPSASLMYVPIRGEHDALGVLSIQSYTPEAYTEDDLKLLQALADYCSGALERDMAEERLRWSEATNRALLNAMPDPIFRLDRDGTFLNFNGSQHLLAAGTDIVGKTVERVFPAALAQQMQAAIERVFETRAVQIYEHEFELNGSTHNEEVRIAICGDNDVLAVIREITERKRAEAAQLQARKIESIGVLSAGIAHEFNNLLMVMLGNAELAQMDLPKGAPTHNNLQQIERAARRAAQLTQQMLAFAGKSHTAFKPIDISALIDGLHEQISSVVQQRARLVYRLQPMLPSLMGDTDQIKQMLLNLVANAADAIDSDDQIHISTGSVELSQAELDLLEPLHHLAAGGYVFVEISDNGIGMDGDTQDKMFDPFYSNKSSGSGLSLAAVLGIVRAHHGAIEVRSALGDGTTIRVLLPAAVQRATPANRATEPGLQRITP